MKLANSLVLGLIGLATIGSMAGCPKKKETDMGNFAKKEAENQSKPTVTVSAKDLLSEYKIDQETSRSKYSASELFITGKVKKVGDLPADKSVWIVELDTGNEDDQFLCSFEDPTQIQRAKEFKVGQDVRIKLKTTHYCLC